MGRVQVYRPNEHHANSWVHGCQRLDICCLAGLFWKGQKITVGGPKPYFYQISIIFPPPQAAVKSLSQLVSTSRPHISCSRCAGTKCLLNIFFLFLSLVMASFSCLETAHHLQMEAEKSHAYKAVWSASHSTSIAE